MLHKPLRDGVFFTQHNLATDGSFNEFRVVCRQHAAGLHFAVHRVLAPYESPRASARAWGARSHWRTPHAASYEELEGAGRVFRRVS